jgi:hypothetical protein
MDNFRGIDPKIELSVTTEQLCIRKFTPLIGNKVI